MTNREDLDKLFEAALHQKAPPSRFGTPESQRKAGPVSSQPLAGQQTPAASRFQSRGMPQQPEIDPQAHATPQGYPANPEGFPAPSQGGYQQPEQQQALQAAPYGQQAYQQPVQPPRHVAEPTQGYAFTSPPPASRPVPAEQRYSFGAANQAAEDAPILEGQAAASLDTTINSELAAILDEKVAKEKRGKRRSLMMTAVVFLGVTGGGSAWFVSSPARVEALNKTISEIKSAGDIKGMVAKYQQALDKVAVRGEQIDAATISMGVDPASAADVEDQGFDKEMRAMMGNDAGPTSAARDALVREKFDSVQQSGSLMPGK